MVTIFNNDDQRVGLVVPYDVRRQLWQDLGVNEEVVFTVIVHQADAEGAVEIKHATVAAETGLSKSTVQRAIEALSTTGWIKTEHQFVDNRQRLNRYRIPPFVMDGLGDHPGGQIDHPKYVSSHVDLDVSDLSPTSESEKKKSLHTYEVLTEDPAQGGFEGGSLRDPCEEVVDSEVVLEGGKKFPEIPSTPFREGHEGRRRNLFDIHRQSLWLVGHFEEYAVKTARRTITDDRRFKWFADAQRMVRSFTHDDIVRVISWIFTDCSGEFPFAPRFPERRVTSLKQILQNFDTCLDHLADVPTSIPVTPEMSESGRQDLRTRLEQHQ